MDRRMAFLQVSAEEHGLHPQFLGYGVNLSLPEGVGAKVNALGHYVRTRVADGDILIYADTFAVLVFAEEADIVARFEELERASNRSLVFGAEQTCSPDLEGLCDSYPEAPFRWRFLDGGLIAGRGHALKAMLQPLAPSLGAGGDQYWYQQYFREHSEDISLDVNCALLCAVWGLNPRSDGAELQDGRVVVPETGNTPSMVHFVGTGGHPHWDSAGRAGGPLYDTFRGLYPKASAALIDAWWFGLHIGSTHDITAYDGAGLLGSMRGIMCLRCNVVGSAATECGEYRGYLGEQCLTISVCLALLVLAPVAVLGHYCLTGHKCPAPSALQASMRRAAIWLRLQLRQTTKKPEMVV